jgi:leader peptidase (prepilin peptidase)/N-methyltransferase
VQQPWIPDWFGYSVAVLLGIVVGSFLNVCIWRLPRDESLSHPGSHCPDCNTPLKAIDLVPIFSFLVQGGKCRYCKRPISWRYIGIESLTGAYFAFVYYCFNWSVQSLVFALFGAALIATFFIDLEHYIIPDQLNIFGVAIGIAHDGWNIATGVSDWHSNFFGWDIPIPESIMGVIVGGGVFVLIAVVSYYMFKKEGMGGGDIKLAAAIGANVGASHAMVSFFVAVLLGTVIGVSLIALKKKGRKDYVPFGPFMVAGAYSVMFFWNSIEHVWAWYLNRVGLGS